MAIWVQELWSSDRENQVLYRFIINIQVANATILILIGDRIIVHREDNL